MTLHTTPSSMDFRDDASLGSILDALEPHSDKALVIEYAGRTIRPGYHVTEVNAGSFLTINCGGNPDRWRETILQVEDLAPEGERDFMPVGKFRSILGQVATRIELDSDARLTFEVGPAESAMQVFDVSMLQIETNRVIFCLGARPAICKPRHRAAQQIVGPGKKHAARSPHRVMSVSDVAAITGMMIAHDRPEERDVWDNFRLN